MWGPCSGFKARVGLGMSIFDAVRRSNFAYGIVVLMVAQRTFNPPSESSSLSDPNWTSSSIGQSKRLITVRFWVRVPGGPLWPGGGTAYTGDFKGGLNFWYTMDSRFMGLM